MSDLYLVCCTQAHFHILCSRRSHKGLREIWGENSENSFSLKRTGALENCQEPRGEDGCVFAFHFGKATELHWRPLKVRRNSMKPQLSGAWIAAEFKQHFSCSKQKNSDNRNLQMPRNTKPKCQGPLRQCHGIACEGISEFLSEGLLIGPAKTNCQRSLMGGEWSY